MDWQSVMFLVFGTLAFTSGIIGYPICLGLIGPIILEANGKRKTSESVLYFGNILLMEHDLKMLADQNVKSAIRLLAIVNFCKWSIVVSLCLFAMLIVFFVM